MGVCSVSAQISGLADWRTSWASPNQPGQWRQHHVQQAKRQRHHRLKPQLADDAQEHQAHHDEKAIGLNARHQIGLFVRQQSDQNAATIQRGQREQVKRKHHHVDQHAALAHLDEEGLGQPGADQRVQHATFEDLYQYCYRVASVVGLTTIHIFGFTSPEAIPLAEKCGIAFQLTNILRDVKEDADLGRTYIPAEDLQRFGVTVADLQAGRRSDAFGRLMEFEIDRARSYYAASQPLLGLIQPKTRRSLWTLITIYSRLLERVSEAKFDVLTRRISLSVFEKLWIMLRAAFM